MEYSVIPHDKLLGIKNQTQEAVEIINQGIEWSNNFLKAEQKTEVKYEIKKYRRTLKKIREVVTENPSLALFGASQVGKSYMANNLLFDEDNKLMIFNYLGKEGFNDSTRPIERDLIDFIKYINPEGNQNEATGAITRFSSSVEIDAKKLPIKVKIFSIKDVISVLCDTYYYDYQDSKPAAKLDELKMFCETLTTHTHKNTKQKYISDDDIYEIQEYLDKYFIDKPLVINLKDTNYWDILADNIENIEIDKLINVFGILWNNHQEINSIFVESINFLKSLNFSKNVRVDFDALLREYNMSIIDVGTLNKFFENDQKINVQLENDQKVSVSAGKFAFLTCEVTLTVSSKSIDNRPFIKTLDIIDFPGARSRPEITNFSQKSLLEMLTRGKISYLFNNYSSNYKTNILATCMRTAQTNVTSVPRLINQWIMDNLGETIEERTQNVTFNPPPLFVIFTWWNTQLLFIPESDTPDPTDRIKKLFETRYKEEIQGSFDWNKKWVLRNNSPQKFDNFYLLRDFVRSKETFNQTRDLESGQFLSEKEENPFVDNSKEKFYQNYKKEFIRYNKENNSFFSNPEEAFEEASVPNKDGSLYIIKKLLPITSNTASVPIYLNVLNNTIEKAKKELSKHYHNDNADENLRKASRDGSDLQFKMDIVFGDEVYLFGKFVETLMITEGEVFALYHDLLQSDLLVKKKNIKAYILIRANNPGFVSEDSAEGYKKNVEVLMKNYHRESIEETEKYFLEEEIDLKELFYGDLHNLQNNSSILAQELQTYWFDVKLNVANFDLFIQKGFQKSTLEKLFDNLKVNFTKNKVVKIIANDIKAFTDVIKLINEAEELVAHVSAGRINEFVNSIGWSYYSDTEKNKIRETNSQYNLNLRIPEEVTIFRSMKKNSENEGEMSVEKILDYLEEHLNEDLSKININSEALQNMPMIKNYQQWITFLRISFIANCDIPTYDPEANRQLGVILDKIKEYNFTIN